MTGLTAAGWRCSRREDKCDTATYHPSMNRSNPSAAESTSEVSAALVPRSAELAADIYRLIVQEIPALRRDARVLARVGVAAAGRAA
jgi:hypothetical protein